MNRTRPLLLQLIVLILPLLLPLKSQGEELPPSNSLVRKIPFPEGDPGTIAWNISWDTSGVAYVGRDQLWRWDGTEWTVHGPDTLRELRGMHFDQRGRLWLGGVNSIGYFDVESLEYVSVLDWLPEEHRILNEVWEVHHDGDFLWVGTAHKLLRLSPDSFKVWEFSSDHRVVFHFVGNEVFAHVPLVGLFRIEPNGFHNLCDLSQLGEHAILILKEKSPTTLMGVSGSGYFEIEKAKWAISRYVPNEFDGLSAVGFSGSVGFVCGTLGNGITVLDNRGFVTEDMFGDARFENTSLIKIAFESEHELWVLSAFGITEVLISFPIQEIDQIGIGTISDTETGDGQVFLGSRNGIFLANSGSAAVEEIESAEVRKLQRFSEHLFFNDYNRVISLENETSSVFFSQIGEIWNFHVTRSGYMHISYQDRIATYGMDGEGAWELLHEQDVEGPLAVLEEDESGIVWGCVENGPLYSLQMDDDLEQVLVNREQGVLGKSLLRDRYRMEVTARGPVLIFSDQLIRWNPANREWEKGMLPDEQSLPLAHAFKSGPSQMEGWITYPGKGSEGPVVAQVDWAEESELRMRLIPWVDLTGLGKIHKMEYLDGSAPRLAFMGMKGVMLADPDLSKNLPPPRKPVIWDAYTNRPAGEDIELNYGDSGLRLKYSSPGTGLYYPVRYQTRIRGLEKDWAEASGYTDREIGQLLGGSYVFEVVAVDPIGRLSEASTVRLTVHPPWYRTTLAQGALAIFIILAVYGYTRFHAYRVRIKQVELESLVEERTTELRRANSFKDDFIANMSHEIRNPLNGVIGLIGQLREGESPSNRNLLALRGAARYLRTTVEAVLDFSKLESGTVTLQETEFDLMNIADGVLRIYKDHADDKGLELVSRLCFSDGVRIYADERKFQQILGNLMSNAVKFTDEGSVLVELSLSGSSGACTLNIVVKDTGCGIPESQRKRVFEKFQQCKTGELKPSGTGLGLALVRSFVDTMDGTLSMDSVEGVGTSMEVCLPVKIVTEDPRADQNGHIVQPGRALSVLIVEDLEYNRVYLEDFLTSRGCHVTSADDGLDGFNLASQGSFDLILLDWELPGMNGLEIAKRLREGNLIKDHVRIVGMTAFATFAVREQCLEGGMNTFLTKPIDPSLLMEELQAAGMADASDEALAGNTSSQAAGGEFILHAGILGEMTSDGEWAAQKERWLGIFESHMGAVRVSLQNDDLSSLRKDAHKLLGHLRMLKMREMPDSILDLLTAAHAEDLQGASAEWDRFLEMLPRFQREFDSLDLN